MVFQSGVNSCYGGIRQERRPIPAKSTSSPAQLHMQARVSLPELFPTIQTHRKGAHHNTRAAP